MQHLLRKQIITGALLLCISFASMAQKGNVNQPFYDEDLFYLGFNVGINNNYYNFNRNVEFASPAAGAVRSINPKNNISLTMGLAGTLRLSTHTLLRLNPTVVIAGSKNLFTFTRIEYPNSNPTMNAATALINIPLALKIVSDRYNAFHYTDIMRHYVFVGGKIDYDLVGPNGSIQNSTSGSEPIYKNIFNSLDYGYEMGLGVSFYLPYATISPEVKFSYGVRNLNKGAPLLSSIRDITSNFVYFTIHVE
jgi:hypothetical protein